MADNYKETYLPLLQKSTIYKTLNSKCAEENDTSTLTLLENAIPYACQRTKTIISHMGEFTLHDSDHLFRVLYLMEKLLPEQMIKNFSVPELLLLVLSAFFHDIGMAPDEKDILTWKKIWDANPQLDSIEISTFNEFKRFYSARPNQHEIIQNLINQGKNSDADIIKSYQITEFIRQTHAERARDIIEKDWKEKVVYLDTDLTLDFAQICFSHNENAWGLLELDKSYLCAANTYACLPLIGVILRLADILDFDAKRTPSILFSHLYVRNPVSLKEWNKHRAIEAWEINPEIIQFSAKCKHPAIESSVHEFCDIIDKELSVCNNIITVLNEHNRNKGRDIIMKIPFKVNREKIKTERDIHNKPIYLYRDTKFNLSKRQVVELLMGTKLYGNPEVALRELLQNSIDACLLRNAQEIKWENPYNPEISVKYYHENNDTILEIEDNGTGMDQYIIDEYYTKVGSSFYKSADFYNLKAESNAKFTPTSRFGIGILSCFMVADTLIVDTRRVYEPHKSSDALNLTVEGQDSIFWMKNGDRKTPGTTTKLVLRKTQNPWETMNNDEFIKSVENVIPNPPFKINIITDSKTKIRDENSFMKVTASSLKDHSWQYHEHLKMFEIPLDYKEIGILGSALVAVLDNNNEPAKSIKLNSKNIEIDGKLFSLEKEIRISDNAFQEHSKSVTVNGEGDIHEYDSISKPANSKSRFSLHGIEIPSTLFPQPWEQRRNQVKISWPFPLILVLDICGDRDLDLNSSRTEVIISDKWGEFEEELAYLICSKIANNVSSDYWGKLKQIFIEHSKSEIFTKGLNRVAKT